MKSKKIIIQNDFFIKENIDESVYPTLTQGDLGFYFPNHPEFGFELVSLNEESITLRIANK